MTTLMKNRFSKFASILTGDKALAPLTTYGIGGTARYYLEPNDLDQLAAVVRVAHHDNIAIRILGGGTNLLVATDRFEGAVISLTRCNRIERNGNTVTVGAGTRMQSLIVRCIDWELGGLEGLAGIPGTAGGFVAMNAGGRWGETADAVERVTLVSPTGAIVERSAEQLNFGYRHAELQGGYVAAVTFRLKPGDRKMLQARRQEIMGKKVASQPLGEQSPGCAFKNPLGGSAGQLIEAAGLKRTRIGGAQVSERHANFILNTGEATAQDVLALLNHVRDCVKKNSGIDLTLELKIWN